MILDILIDTHIFLWLLSEPKKVGAERLSLLEEYTNNIYLSSISIAELMIKASVGKIKIEFNPTKEAEKAGLELIGFNCSEALLLKDLPFHHRDPFDRMLICQALSNNYFLMTDDEKFEKYNCKLL